jgi:hypothetical protein
LGGKAAREQSQQALCGKRGYHNPRDDLSRHWRWLIVRVALRRARACTRYRSKSREDQLDPAGLDENVDIARKERLGGG